MERHVFAPCRSKRHFSDSDRLSSHHDDQRTRPSNIQALELTLANLNNRISSLSLTSRPALESCSSEYSSGFDDMSLKSGSSVDSCFSSVESLNSQSREKQCPRGLDVNHNGPATPIAADFSGRPEFLQRSFSSPGEFPNFEQNGNTVVTPNAAGEQVASHDVKVTVSAQLKDSTEANKPGWRTWLRGQTRLSLRDSSTRNKTKLAIFDEAGGSHVVLICETTTARDLIQMLVVRTQSDESVHWTIIEDIQLGRAERIVEDHELILTVKKNWSTPRESKFVFKKDPRKNDPFIHPERLFSEHMKDRKSDRKRLNAEAERAREILMMDLVVESDRTPDLQGDLYLKAAGTGKWQKVYCFLRGSGLHYSTKGKTQDPKRLRCFSRLDDIDVYVVKRANRRDKVPTSHCLMFKPKTMDLGDRMKEFGCICTKDEDALLSWLAGIRTVKYGAILRQNFIRRRGTDDVAFLADVS